MNTEWLKKHYGHLPQDIKQVLFSNRLHNKLSFLCKLSRKYPTIYVLHSHIESILYKSGRKKEALKVWRNTIKVFPRLPNPYFIRAHRAIKSGRYCEASKFLNICLRYDKGYFSETANFWRAECLLRTGNPMAAKIQLSAVSDSFSEPYFWNSLKTRTKADMLSDILKSIEERNVI